MCSYVCFLHIYTAITTKGEMFPFQKQLGMLRFKDPCEFICIDILVCIFIYMYINICIYTYIYIYVYMYVCIRHYG
jgi:hypothetical protein